MRLTKYTPMTPFETVFNRLSQGFPVLDACARTTDSTQSTSLRVPRTNVSETDKEYTFLMEMPGLTKADVEITLEGDTLVVKGGKAEDRKSDDNGTIRREFRTGGFERSFSVGDGIDRDGVNARMEDGVVTVTLPKSSERVGRKITIG